LHAHAFPHPRQIKRSADDEIKILERRSNNVISARITERAERLLLNRLGVEPLLDSPRPVVDVADKALGRVTFVMKEGKIYKQP
jgi:hypothetical protein